MVPLVYWHNAAEIPCAAADLANSEQAYQRAAAVHAVTIWRTVRGTHAPRPMGVIADTLRASLRDLAQADARLYRGLADELAATPAARPALPADEIAAAIALLEAHGYTVTRP